MPHPTPPAGSRLAAMVGQRCPRCLYGAVYSGFVTMHERCPACGLVFEREHGYFTGAMVVSYALGIPALAAITGIVLLLTRWPVEWAVIASDVLFLALVPGIFRYSRVLWMHFDRKLDPD